MSEHLRGEQKRCNQRGKMETRAEWSLRYKRERGFKR